MALPVITSIAPITGPAAGGTLVTLTGTGFTGALAVGFGATDASALSVMSDTSMVAVSPAGTGTANVTVVTPNGRSAVNAAVQFAYAGDTSGGSPAYYVDPALTAQIVGSLINFIQSNNSPEAQAAQAILMRRMALEGDVIGSRVPPPKNISEIGGYLNLLDTLGETAMREQTLAGALGVAGPTPALGWNTAQPLSMVSLANDRPPGAFQSTLPLSVLVRSDFVSAFQTTVTALHAQGATLPCAAPTTSSLPPGGPGTTVPTDLLSYVGRVLTLAPATALVAPATDPIVLARPSGSGPFALAVNATSATPASYDVLVISGSSIATQTLSLPLVMLTAPTGTTSLVSAGFYSAIPFPAPSSPTDIAWARLTNITGLVAGSTKYGDELALLFPPGVISASALAPVLGYTWDGTNFTP